MATQQASSYTDVTDYFRSTVPDLKDVPDEELILFVGDTYPEFTKEVPAFGEAYRAIRHEKKGIELARQSDELKLAQATISPEERKDYLLNQVGVGTASIAEQAGGVLQSTPGSLLAFPPISLAGEISSRLGGPDFNLGKITGKAIREYGKEQEQEFAEAAAGLGEPGPILNIAGLVGQTAAASMPSMFAALWKGLGAASSVAGAQSYGQMWSTVYDAKKAEGATDDEADVAAVKAATAAGVITAGLTRSFGGVERFLSKLGAAGAGKKLLTESFGKTLLEVLKGAALEVPEESIDQFAQDVIQDISTTKNLKSDKPEVRKMAWAKIAENASQAGLIAFLMGGMVGGGVAGLRQVAGNIGTKPTETPPPIPTETPVEPAPTEQAEAPPVVPPSQAGVPVPVAVKNVARSAWASLKRQFKEYADEPIEPLVQFDENHMLPNLQPAEKAAKLFNKQYGWEKMPIAGALTSPLMGRHIKTQPHLIPPILRWYAETHGVAQSTKGMVSAMLAWTDRVFGLDAEGNLNVKAPEGASLKQSDVFESLMRGEDTYQLTDEQKLAFETLWDVIKDARRFANDHGIPMISDQETDEELDSDEPSGLDLNAYFPRIVEAMPPPSTPSPATGGKKPGGTPFYQKSRLFDSEQEGWDAGYRYMLSPATRVATLVERVYKKAADRRLITDPNLKAAEELQKGLDYRAMLESEVAAGIKKPGDVEKYMAAWRKKRTVQGFSERIDTNPQNTQFVFPPEVAGALSKEFPISNASLRRSAARVNNAIKGVFLGLDFGVLFLQLQVIATRHPKIFTKSAKAVFQSFASPEFMARYLNQNMDVVRKLVQMGSSVGRLPEMMAGLEKGADISVMLQRLGNYLEKNNRHLSSKTAKAAGWTVDAFARSFTGALDVAKIELFKAWEPMTPQGQTLEMVQGIESLLNLGRMESSGLSSGRSLIERVFLLAPAYTRGGLNLIANLGRPGVAGKMARQAMGSFIMAWMAAFWAFGMALGHDPEELLKRMNPGEGQFGMLDIPVGGGRVIKVGLGGIIRSLLRLMANLVKTASDNPGNFNSLSSDKNPLMRWLRGHAAPVPSMLWTGLTGRDYLGGDAGVGRLLGQSTVPLGVQPTIDALIDKYKQGKEIEPGAVAAETAMTMFGLNAYPESFGSTRYRRQNEIAMKLYDKLYENLNVSQMATVWGKIKNDPIVMAAKEEELSPGFVEYLERQKSLRRSRLMEEIPGDVRDVMRKHHVKVPDISMDLKVGSRQARLTKDQADRLEEIMAGEYAVRFSKVNLEGKNAKATQAIVSKITSAATKSATRKLIVEINKNASRKQSPPQP